MVTISNINNKYIAAKETAYGTTPSPFTSVNLGHIQTITISEDDNLEKNRGINSGHTASSFEDGLYNCNVSISTRITKASLPILMEMCLGTKTDDATDYTVVSDNTEDISYSIKTSYTTGKVALINGISVKDFDLTGAKGDMISLTMNCIAKKATVATETLTVSTNTDAIFKDLDMTVTIGGNAFILNSYNITGNWNVTDDEGRGIEVVSAGERRLIQRVIKHAFDVSGSYEAEIDDNGEFGYTEERTNDAIVFTISRGTDNEHVFTLSNTRSSSRENELSTENSKRIISYDYEALDVGLVGDL
jgi:hypothetical protein